MANLTPLVGTNTLKEMYPKVNANEAALNAEIAANKASQDAAGASLQTQITNEQANRIAADAAHAVSTSAHDADNIAFTSGTSGIAANKAGAAIREVKQQLSNIIASQVIGKDNEVIDAKTLEPGYATGRTITVFGDVLRDMQAKLASAAIQTAALKHGWNYVLSSVSSPLNLSISGRTLVNLLGKVGGCESLTPFTLAGTGTVTTSTTQVKQGTNSIKFVVSANGCMEFADFSYPLDTSKQYILAGWIYIESWTSGSIHIKLRDVGTATDRYTASADTSKVGSWQYVFVKIPTANALVGTGFRLAFGNSNTATYTAYFDAIDLYEVSVTDYTAIGTTYTASTTPSIDDIWPYVDGVKHVSGAAITKIGKNLLNSMPDTVHANAVVNAAYSLTLSATAAFQGSSFTIPMLPNQLIYFSATHNGRIEIEEFNASDVSLKTTASNSQSFSLTTQATTSYVKVRLTSAAAGTMTFANWMLTFDANATFVERNDDYMYAVTDSFGNPLKLGSLWGGSSSIAFKDTLTPMGDGKAKLTAWFRKDIPLVGSLPWTSRAGSTGKKSVITTVDGVCADIRGGAQIGDSNVRTDFVISKYNGAILRNVSTTGDGIWGGTAPADCANIDERFIIVSIDNADSGWGDSYTPTAQEIQAFFYGWRMYNSDVGNTTPYNGTGTKAWAKIQVGGTVVAGSGTTVLPTTQNDHASWTTYKLTYQLAQAVEEIVNVEGSINFNSGGNMIEVSEGVIVRERIFPQYTGTSFRTYTINNVSFAGSVFKNRTEKMVAVYKGVNKESKASITTDLTSSFGKQKGSINEIDFDVTAEYYATYFIMSNDKGANTVNVIDVTADYRTTPKDVIDAVVRRLADVETNATILAQLLNTSVVKGAGERMQAGSTTATIATPGTAVTVAVTFPIAYASSPKVQLTMTSSAGGTAGYINLFAENVTTTGFTLRVNAYAAGAIGVNWEAKGK